VLPRITTLAFVGDGAKLLVPDIAASSSSYTARSDNVSIFSCLTAGAPSSTPTGRVDWRGAAAGESITCWSPTLGRTFVDRRSRQLHTFDGKCSARRCYARRDQLVLDLRCHTATRGDGLSLFSSLGWQRDELPELAYKIASSAKGLE